MEIITSHNSIDFDGLASMVAASILYPGAIMVLPGTLSPNVKHFMGLYKDSLMFKNWSEIDISKVEKAILVDTRSRNRLGIFKELNPERCQFVIYDHHPPSPDDFRGAVEYIAPVGATTTLLVEQIEAKGLSIRSFDATILALGIYEDTGSLMFASTTDRDARAVAFLLARGANLNVIGNFIERPFTVEQRELLQDLLASLIYYDIQGCSVAIATCTRDGFVPGLSFIVHRMMEVESCDAMIVAVQMQGKVNVVARSKTSNIPVNDILEPLGVRGHEKAAAGMVRNKSLNQVVETVLERLREKARPAMLARDIMSTPVKSISQDLTMDEAGKIMLRYGHTGMPVVQGEQMVGVISRRDVDKALLHGLGHAPVKGFMTREVVYVEKDTPVSEIQRLMVERDIGRVPVLENGRLVGIVSRTDILRTLHGEHYPEDHAVLFAATDEASRYSCQELIKSWLPGRLQETMKTAGEVAERLQQRVYCVGGFVRDMLLKVPNFDLDLVVEGDGMEFAQALAETVGGRARTHERFKTGVVIFPDGMKVDVATARTEYYEFPAALPRIERASIKEDLYRRDFTINTLAIALNPENYGELIDFFGGRRDINNGIIRILYNLSFVEDPTRILRAIRFEQRYKFTIEPDTLRFAQDAIARRLLGRLSFKRILQELILILNEKDPVPALRRMNEIGAWEFILPEVKLGEETWITLRRIPRVLGWMAEEQLGTRLRPWVVYMAVLLSQLDNGRLSEVLNRYPLDRMAVNALKHIPDVKEIAKRLEREPMSMSQLDRELRRLPWECLAYLLLIIHQEPAWENVARYLKMRDDVRVKLNGHDLMKLGIARGPVYQEILSALRAARMDGLIQTREDEIRYVQSMIEGGQLNV